VNLKPTSYPDSVDSKNAFFYDEEDGQFATSGPLSVQEKLTQEKSAKKTVPSKKSEEDSQSSTKQKGKLSLSSDSFSPSAKPESFSNTADAVHMNDSTAINSEKLSKSANEPYIFGTCTGEQISLIEPYSFPNFSETFKNLLHLHKIEFVLPILSSCALTEERLLKDMNKDNIMKIAGIDQNSLQILFTVIETINLKKDDDNLIYQATQHFPSKGFKIIENYFFLDDS